MVPSPRALQKLLNTCNHFAMENDIKFNSAKTVCMYIRSNKTKDLNMPQFFLNNECIKFQDKEKYLGVIVNNLCKHDDDILKQSKSVYCRGNMLIQNFRFCDTQVKIQLFKSYCSSLYCCHLWYNYSLKMISKVKTAYKQVYTGNYLIWIDTLV